MRDGFCSATFAHVQKLSAGRGEIENRGRNEIVVEYDVRAADEAKSLDCEQVRVAGSSSHQIDCAAGNTRLNCGSFDSLRSVSVAQDDGLVFQFNLVGLGHLARGAGRRFADLPMSQLMQKLLARLTAGMRCENFSTELAQILKPCTEIVR